MIPESDDEEFIQSDPRAKEIEGMTSHDQMKLASVGVVSLIVVGDLSRVAIGKTLRPSPRLRGTARTWTSRVRI